MLIFPNILPRSRYPRLVKIITNISVFTILSKNCSAIFPVSLSLVSWDWLISSSSQLSPRSGPCRLSWFLPGYTRLFTAVLPFLRCSPVSLGPCCKPGKRCATKPLPSLVHAACLPYSGLPPAPCNTRLHSNSFSVSLFFHPQTSFSLLVQPYWTSLQF